MERSLKSVGVFLLVLLALGYFAPASVLGAEKEPLTITVTAESCPSAVPDLAEISVGVAIKKAKPSDALRALRSSMGAVVKAIKDQGVDDKDIQTHNLSLSLAYKEDDRNRTVPDGYQSSQSLRIRVRDIDKVSTVLQVAIDNGATLFYGLKWDLSDANKETLSAQALPDAIAKAKEKAETLAKHLSKSLGDLRSFSHGIQMPQRPYRESVRASYDSVPAGETEVRVVVTMTYELK